MYCRGYITLRRELHSHIANADTHYPSLSDNEKTKYLLRAENTDTSRVYRKMYPSNVSKKEGDSWFTNVMNAMNYFN